MKEFINANDAKNLFVNNAENINKKLLIKMATGPSKYIEYANCVKMTLSKFMTRFLM